MNDTDRFLTDLFGVDVQMTDPYYLPDDPTYLPKRFADDTEQDWLDGTYREPADAEFFDPVHPWKQDHQPSQVSPVSRSRLATR